MQRLCLAALSLALLNPTVGTPNDKAISTPHADDRSADQRGSQSTPLVIKIVGAQSAEEKAAEDKKRDDNETRNQSHTFWLTLAIAFAACVQAGAVVWQIFIYKRQTRIMLRSMNATKRSADAARDGANALMAVERGWLLIAPTEWRKQIEIMGPAIKTQYTQFPIAIKNVGRTPVRITAVAMRYVVLDSLSDLPDEPDYPSPTAYHGRLLVPQDSYGETVDLEEADRTTLNTLVHALQHGKKHLYFYGYVKYLDEFGKERGTFVGYAYEYKWISGALQPFLNKKQAGPPAYNRAT